jgi:NOL1/NOP2/fmu family ribosome biogenesis protein
MQKLNFLNSRQVKKIRETILNQFNHFPIGDYAFVQNEKNRLFIVNRDIAKINLENLRIDKIGLYFAEIRDNSIRLSKEGAAFLVQNAKENSTEVSNIVPLTKTEVKAYFHGIDLKKDLGEENKLILLEHNSSILGCSQYKDQKILNFLPKIHRGEVIV